MIRQREFFGRSRRRLILLAVLGGLCLALVAEHSGLENAQMDDAMGEAVSMCLAVLGGGALAIGATALVRALPRPRSPRELAPVLTWEFPLPTSSAPQARGSPVFLQVLRR